MNNLIQFLSSLDAKIKFWTQITLPYLKKYATISKLILDFIWYIISEFYLIVLVNGLLYFIIHTEQVVENTQILISDTDVLKKIIFALSIIFYIYTNNLAIIAVKKTSSFNSTITVANKFIAWDQAIVRYLKLTMENLIVLIISILILLLFSEHFFLVFFNAETTSNLLLFCTFCTLTQVVINKIIKHTKHYLDDHILNYIGQITSNQIINSTTKYIIDYRSLIFKSTFIALGLVIYIFLGFSSPNQFFVGLFTTQSIIFIGFSFALLFMIEFIILSKTNNAKFFFILSVLALTFSLWNDPTEAEYLERKNSQTDHQTHFKNWVNHKKPVKGDTIPLILIAAEGGGIRAMAWTLLSINMLNKKIASNKKNYIYMISGVSGGAVGATMYASLLNDKYYKQNQRITDSTLNDLIIQDYLANIVRGNIFKSPIKLFSPFNFKSLDRNTMLEDSWSNAYFDKTQSHSLDKPFLDIWAKDSVFQIPSLILNCTLAETGEKAIISNLNFNTQLKDVKEIYNEINDKNDFKAKSAASLSARFPVITSGGLIKTTKNNRYHLTDGGYVDNTGIETCLQVIAQLRDGIEYFKRNEVTIEPYIFYLKNSSSNEGITSDKPLMAYESQNIIQSFYNSWDKESSVKSNIYFQLSFQKKLAVKFYVIELNRKSHIYPLGWQLSKTSLQEMSANIANLYSNDIQFGTKQEIQDLARNIKRLEDRIDGKKTVKLLHFHKAFINLKVAVKKNSLQNKEALKP